MTFERNIWIDVLILAIGHLGVATRAQAAATCGPVAAVQGDGPAVAAVVSDLERRGITTYPVAGCPVVRVRIEKKVDGIVVTIVDSDGRTSERTTNGVTAAATLIESWTRTDVLAPLLTPRPDRVAPPSPPVPRTASATTLTSHNVTSRSSGARTALSLAASGETSLGSDGSIWFGLRVGACLPIGPICAGALMRVSDDAGLSGESQESHTSRLASDLLIGAGLPVTQGRLTLIPEIAVGVGWMRSKSLKSAIGGDAVDIDSGGVRVSASMQVSVSVSANVALDFGIDVDVAPMAHTGPFDARLPFLAGEPGGYLRGGLGIRLGAP